MTPSLARVGMIREILSWLGNPDTKLRIIHIAGTNGKGSTGAMLANVLNENGYRVGHFSAPAVNDDRDVITMDGAVIAMSDVVSIVKDIITQVKKHGGNFSTLGKFEWWVLIALVYFGKRESDFVVLEAGRGGHIDATNAILNPYMVVFTKISLDNIGITGKTLVQVAKDKAEIIKPGALVVSYPGQDLDVLKILKNKTISAGATWNPLQTPTITVLSSEPQGLHLNINDLQDLYLSLTGNYQANNLNTVVQVIDLLRSKGFRLAKDRTATALAHVSIPGRMEYNADRNILYDGAHNPEGMRALANAIRAWHLPFKPTFVLGLMDDKNAHEMIDEVTAVAATIIAVTPDQKGAMTADELAAYVVMNANVDVEIADDPSAAVQLARRNRESSKSLIVVTGSFFTLHAIFNEDEV
ncbi:bifunctional folylpolyglutamate synthase/dihydrofolate synthase [Weissella diestrammenae]|uniref:bifunctional folylpolyglutamate synthase/dihydrofolate synthase n=1 Tax=Weissella diestrammenae TaxID=1162633 RepID=UPI001FAE003D|nr:cyanophycin synthetase [Weissella diestrammenae]